MHWSVFAWSALAIAIVMISTWVVSLFLRNASIVDPMWSLGFVVVGWVSFAAMHQHVVVAGHLVEMNPKRVHQ